MFRQVICCIALLATPALALDNSLGRLPPLGWSTWNYFANDINESLILDTADAMVSTGLAKVGFEYINIDAAYLLHQRHPDTNKLQVDSSRFPRGMKYVAEYLHNRSLKLGVYTDIGQGSCGRGPGSYGYYNLDAATIANDWDADYLKVDYCGGKVSLDAEMQLEAWQNLRDALNATGKPIYYSICPRTRIAANATGTPQPYAGKSVYSPPATWTAEERHGLANSILVEYLNNFDLWYADTVPAGDSGPIPLPGGVITNLDSMVAMTELGYSAPGSWNDADMLQMCTYGEGATRHLEGMRLSEYRAHYAVWSVLASPLIHSADLRKVGQRHPDCLELMLNPEIIAVNQDVGGHAARLVAQRSNSSDAEASTKTIVAQVFVRPLGENKQALAVVLLNRGEEDATLSVAWDELQLPNATSMAVRDVMARRELGVAQGSFSATVPRHDVAFVTLTPLALESMELAI